MPIKCRNIQLCVYLCLLRETLCNKKNLHRETLRFHRVTQRKILPLIRIIIYKNKLYYN